VAERKAGIPVVGLQDAPTRAILDRRRLSRALALIHNHAPLITNNLVKAALERLLFAGRAMDFAGRLHEHDTVTGRLAEEYASFCGIGTDELRLRVLPVMKDAGIVDYTIEDGRVSRVEEFVGVSGSLLDQTALLLDRLNLNDAERSTLQSVLIGSWAPLARTEHLQALTLRGFKDEIAARGLQYSVAVKVNDAVAAHELREDVIYNPNVWGSRQVPIARFLKYRPVEEREVLLSILEQASSRPGLALTAFGGPATDTMIAARKVGLLPTATVSSTAAGQTGETYAFAPLIEAEDDLLVTTEALHGRKLFVAHILFAHEKALSSYGRVRNPVVLVEALVNRGRVGPATNIGTDYHLIEAAGIAKVEEAADGPYLRLVKREIVEGGLMWLKQAYGDEPVTASSGRLAGLRPPTDFSSPELDRARLGARHAATEISKSAILELRKEAQRAARGETSG